MFAWQPTSMCTYCCLSAPHLCCCQAQTLLYDDIKPSNIFGCTTVDPITQQKSTIWKLGDFGSVLDLSRSYVRQSQRVGTIDFHAPELMKDGYCHGLHADSFAVGGLLIALRIGDRPFRFLEKFPVQTQASLRGFKAVKRQYQGVFDKQEMDLLEKCLQHDALARPLALQLLHGCSYFQDSSCQ